MLTCEVNKMFIQDIINKIVNWTYRNDIKAFDQEYNELIKGRQFPDLLENTKKIKIISTDQDFKIPTDNYISNEELIKELGTTNSTDED